MIVRALVSADPSPVNRLRDNGGIRIVLDDLIIPAFCFCPLLVHEGYAGKAHLKVRAEFRFRQVALYAIPFMAFRVENKHAGSPQHIESVKARRVLFDMYFDGQEVFVDELGDLSVAVGFGLQPNASASSRGGAEINQQRFVLLFRITKRSINIFVPFDSHCAIPP
ncbi:MAG TPA: hypothetical protein VNN73_11735 [Blastocatellia bacterium]|nr:hypothetical protein [Blastocatellia bacterium]